MKVWVMGHRLKNSAYHKYCKKLNHVFFFLLKAVVFGFVDSTSFFFFFSNTSLLFTSLLLSDILSLGTLSMEFGSWHFGAFWFPNLEACYYFVSVFMCLLLFVFVVHSFLLLCYFFDLLKILAQLLFKLFFSYIGC